MERPSPRRVEEWPIDRPDRRTTFDEWDDPNADNWDGNDGGTLDGIDIL